MSTGRACWIGAGVACLVSAALFELGARNGNARADEVRRDEPTRIVVGEPVGFAPSARVEPRRTGRSGVALPAEPRVAWRIELSGGVAFPPVVGERGEVTAVLVAPEVVRIDGAGKRVWRVALAGAPAATAPVLLSDGSVVVVTEAHEVWALDQDGAVRWRTKLDLRAGDVLATPLALDNGSVVVVAGSDLMWLSRDGVSERRAYGGSARIVGGLLRHRDALLFTNELGEVWRWRPPGQPTITARFSGAPGGGATLVGADTLIAVVDRFRVEALDVGSSTRRVLLSAPTAAMLFDGPVAIAPNGDVLVATLPGELFAVDPHGVVQRRTVLDARVMLLNADGGTPAATLLGRIDRPSPPLIVDPTGRVGFVRSSGRVGVSSVDGVAGTVIDESRV